MLRAALWRIFEWQTRLANQNAQTWCVVLWPPVPQNHCFLSSKNKLRGLIETFGGEACKVCHVLKWCSKQLAATICLLFWSNAIDLLIQWRNVSGFTWLPAQPESWLQSVVVLIVTAVRFALVVCDKHSLKTLLCSRTGLGKCIHQWDETPGYNSTQALSTKMVFFGCKKRDRQQKKKKTKKRRDKELM